VPENETESRIIKNLSHEPVHIDEVCRISCLPIATVSSTLAMMELKGIVRQTGGMNYILALHKTAADDRMPKRITTPHTEGAAAGSVPNVELMLKDYY
jgi:DNA-binding IclR family transcriptional regulator